MGTGCAPGSTAACGLLCPAHILMAGGKSCTPSELGATASMEPVCSATAPSAPVESASRCSAGKIGQFE